MITAASCCGSWTLLSRNLALPHAAINVTKLPIAMGSPCFPRLVACASSMGLETWCRV